MHADAYFSRGDSHIVCQDYALASPGEAGREGEEGPLFAIVSDGCSSSPRTDVGARLLAHAAAVSLEARGDGPDWPAIVRHAESLGRSLSLPASCLDATLLLAYEGPEGAIRVEAAGDGTVLGRRRSGDIETWDLDFGNAPAYPSYLLDPDRLRAYLAQGLGRRKVEHAVNGRFSGSRTGWIDPEEPSSFAWMRDFSPGDYEFVLLLSDGAQSFHRPGAEGLREPVPLFEVAGRLADIRSSKGSFVIRRCRSFLRRFCAKNLWSHGDDLAVAGIHLGGRGHGGMD